MGLHCPSCGGEVKDSVTVGGGENAQTIAPEGSIGVCSQCFIAVDMDEALDEPVSAEAPSGEASPSGEPGPERPEDSISPEGPDFEPAPTTAPEVSEVLGGGTWEAEGYKSSDSGIEDFVPSPPEGSETSDE